MKVAMICGHGRAYFIRAKNSEAGLDIKMEKGLEQSSGFKS